MSVVIERDRGWKKIRKLLQTLGRDTYVKVGVIGDAASQDHGGLSNASLATIHEFGGGRIPERSFLRSTVSENGEKYFSKMSSVANAMYGGDKERAIKLMKQLGGTASAHVKIKITDKIPPPNAESTVLKKGSDTPLVDTGQLLNSITWATIYKGRQIDQGASKSLKAVRAGKLGWERRRARDRGEKTSGSGRHGVKVRR